MASKGEMHNGLEKIEVRWTYNQHPHVHKQIASDICSTAYRRILIEKINKSKSFFIVSLFISFICCTALLHFAVFQDISSPAGSRSCPEEVPW